MARSVDVPSRAVFVIYTNAPDDEFDWEDFKHGIINCIQYKYKSFYKPYRDFWVSNECKVLLKNKHCSITISEYCGLVAIAFCEEYGNNFSVSYINKIEKGIRKTLSWMDQYYKIGTASNGESFYEKIKINS